AQLARAGQAAPHDPLADARRARRRARAGAGDPRRRPAGPVDAAGLPRPRPLRPRPPGGDRRAQPPHRGVPELLLPARAEAPRRRFSELRQLRKEFHLMDSKRRAGAWLPALAAIAGAVAFAAPASGRAATTDVLGGCPASAYEQPFLRWLDLDSYFLAPNGGL